MTLGGSNIIFIQKSYTENDRNIEKSRARLTPRGLLAPPHPKSLIIIITIAYMHGYNN